MQKSFRRMNAFHAYIGPKWRVVGGLDSRGAIIGNLGQNLTIYVAARA
jgi:hypothetical protein